MCDSPPSRRSTHINRTVQSLQQVLGGAFPEVAFSSEPVVVHSLPLDAEFFFPNTKPCPRQAMLFRSGRERFAEGGGHPPDIAALRRALAEASGDAPSLVNFVRVNDVAAAMVSALF